MFGAGGSLFEPQLFWLETQVKERDSGNDQSKLGFEGLVNCQAPELRFTHIISFHPHSHLCRQWYTHFEDEETKDQRRHSMIIKDGILTPKALF